MSSSFTPSANKILGITFLSLVLVAATYVVTSGKFNMNPNKDAAMTCQGTCYKANLCDSLDRQTAVGTCSTGYVCCGAKYGGSTPTPAPSATPASCPSDRQCSSSQTGKTRCNGDILQKCDGKCWNKKQDCGATGLVCHVFNDSTGANCASVSTYRIGSGTCNQKCIAKGGSCLSVGIDKGGTDNKIMSWGNWTSCATRDGQCGSTVKRLSSGQTYCNSFLPEWTNCRCIDNPYEGK